MIKNKNIIFISPVFFGVEKNIVNRLKEDGNTVFSFDERPFKSTFKKALNAFFPWVFFRTSLKYYKDQLCKCSFKPDVIFVVKGEQVNKRVLKMMRSQFPSAKLILYLWDSVSCIRGIKKLVCYYDAVFSFDRKDCIKYGFHFRPLFCDFDNVLNSNTSHYKYDICFYGTMHTDRFNVLNQVNKICKESNLKIQKFCYMPSKFIRVYYWLTNSGYRRFNKKQLSYVSKSQYQLSEMMNESFAVLDINDYKQSGLTLRTIESLFAGKRIITTNEDIKKYDFYDDKYILVIDRKKVEIPKSFFEDTGVFPLAKNMLHKYSVEGWIEDVFREI